MSGESLVLQLCDDHQALVTLPGMVGFGLPELTPTTLKAEPELLASAEEVEAALARHAPMMAAGWLRRESWAGSYAEDPGRQAVGVALEGEWALSGGRKSLGLLYDGRRWRLMTYREGEVDEEPALREEVQLVGRDKIWLVYAVYWAAPGQDHAAIRRLATRLLGVGEE